jgi:hypothetical protein
MGAPTPIHSCHFHDSGLPQPFAGGDRDFVREHTRTCYTLIHEYASKINSRRRSIVAAETVISARVNSLRRHGANRR